MAHGLNQLVSEYGLLALALIAFVKATGIPIPIPQDGIVLVAATGSASGRFELPEAFGLLLVAMTAGALVQFSVARGPGRNLLYRYGPHIGLTQTRLNAAFRRVENVGFLGIGVAVVTPGVRTAAIPACGLAAVSVRTFILGLVTGTAAFLSFHFFVGYAGTKLLIRFWHAQPHLLILLVLAVAAAMIGWVFLRHRRRHAGEDPLEYEELHSTLCPLCLAVAAADVVARRRAARAARRSTPRSHSEQQIKADSFRPSPPPVKVEAKASEFKRSG
jgi:membrane protein DedA with SNARE-associated domain